MYKPGNGRRYIIYAHTLAFFTHIYLGEVSKAFLREESLGTRHISRPCHTLFNAHSRASCLSSLQNYSYSPW